MARIVAKLLAVAVPILIEAALIGLRRWQYQRHKHQSKYNLPGD